MLTSSNLPSWFSGQSAVRQATPATKVVSLTLKLGKSVGFSPPSNAPKELKRIAQHGCCPCCQRRHFLGTLLGNGLLPVFPSFASEGKSPREDPTEVLNRIHPPRPDWYEELYASAMDKLMKPYEDEISGYKAQLLTELKGKTEKILEIGIGTGPNLKYYADDPRVSVFGVDPNRKMEKYARAAAEAAGLLPSNFTFLQAVGEAVPLEDASVDTVVGTLVLCSVEDVDQTLQEIKRVLKPGGRYIFIEHVAAKDGSWLRLFQGILDPLQQAVADGCHLTRNTATNIAAAGFTDLDVSEAVLSTASFVNPHVYGVAHK